MARFRSVIFRSDISSGSKSTMTNVCVRVYRDYTPLYLKHVSLFIARWPMASSANGGAAC